MKGFILGKAQRQTADFIAYPLVSGKRAVQRMGWGSEENEGGERGGRHRCPKIRS